MPSRSLSLFALFLFLYFPFMASADPKSYENDIAQFEKLEVISAPPSEAALFIGSSSIRMWRTLTADFSPAPVIKRGFGGSTIADCTYYIPRIVAPYNPAVIFLYAGDNDLAAGNTPEQVLADFRAFVAGCRKSLPKTSIQFISIKPSPARWNLWENTQKANALIKQYVSGQKGLGYIDVATPMLDQKGVVRGELFLGDRLHMNTAGYRLWTATIKPKLTELLKTSSSGAKDRNPSAGGIPPKQNAASPKR